MSAGWTKAEYDACPELAGRLHARILDLEAENERLRATRKARAMRSGHLLKRILARFRRWLHTCPCDHGDHVGDPCWCCAIHGPRGSQDGSQSGDLQG